MSSKSFDSYDALRAWLNLSPGDRFVFPFGSSRGWEVTLTDEGVEVTSSFYRVAAGGAYGAAMIHGHNVTFAPEIEASGEIQFGLSDEGELIVTSRRRLTSKDESGFDENHYEMVGAFIGQPDRVLETVAVTIHGAALPKARLLDAKGRLAVYDRVQDSLELGAVRMLWRYLDQA